MEKKYLILPLILLLTITPVFAGYFDNWYKWLHIPPNYVKTPDLLYFLVIPFLGVFIIVWGLLTRIGIFGKELKNVNMLLAFVFTVSSIYYGWVFKVVHFLFGIGSFFAFGAFAIMFFVGIKLFAKKKINVNWKGSALKQLKAKEEELKNLREELKSVEDDKKGEIRTKISDAEKELKSLRDEIERKTDDE